MMKSIDALNWFRRLPLSIAAVSYEWSKRSQTGALRFCPATMHWATIAQTNCPPLARERSWWAQRLRKRIANRRATHVQCC